MSTYCGRSRAHAAPRLPSQVSHASLRVEAAEAGAEPLRRQVDELQAEVIHLRKLHAQSEVRSDVGGLGVEILVWVSLTVRPR